MTQQELEDIRTADSRVAIKRDRYGGEFVMHSDVMAYGHRAILHRRRLLKLLEEHPQLLEDLDNL